MTCRQCRYFNWVSVLDVSYFCLRNGVVEIDPDGTCEHFEPPYEIAIEQADNEMKELRETVQGALKEIEASLAVIREAMAKTGAKE